MKIYQADVPVIATIYVKANSASEALAAIRAADNAALYVSNSVLEESDIVISGRQLDDPELPQISFSPAMSFQVEEGFDESDLEEGYDLDET